MSSAAWEAFYYSLTAFCVVTIILGISILIYMSGSQTHAETMAKIQSCAVEYLFNSTEKIHYVSTEYCAGTISEKVVKVNTVQ